VTSARLALNFISSTFRAQQAAADHNKTDRAVFS
jgi:hypothetical protein